LTIGQRFDAETQRRGGIREKEEERDKKRERIERQPLVSDPALNFLYPESLNSFSLSSSLLSNSSVSLRLLLQNSLFSA
jgi:hypothetical protein